MLARHRDQLFFWEKTLVAALNEGNSGLQEDYEGLVDLMLRKDPNLKGFEQLAPEVQERERGFLLNSVKGFVGYLAHCRKIQEA